MAIEVCGGSRVQGSVCVQGSKNAVLPMMAAAILCEGRTVIGNCPDITDMHAMAEVIRGIGGIVTYEDHCLTIDSGSVRTGQIDEARVKEIRASVLFLGSLLARFAKVRIHYPGGCSIGSRPIDFHLRGFARMGVVVGDGGRGDHICCEAPQGLHGAAVSLPFPSVGATENLVLAAVLADGDTRICHAAREPEIVELCSFLGHMGAKIRGAGTDVIEIAGVKRLHPVRWQLGTDRIALLTWGMMVAGCGGDVLLRMPDARDAVRAGAARCGGVSDARDVVRAGAARCGGVSDAWDVVRAGAAGCGDMAALDGGTALPAAEREALAALGCELRWEPCGLRVIQRSAPKAIPYLCTKPYPGYPTDGQSLVMAVMCKGSGVGIIEEGIFENRFQMIRQLRKMGANIDAVSNRACITGVTRLHGAGVEADDLRSGAGLLIAAAMADGKSEICGEHYIYRGYEDIENQMRAIGIDVRT